MSIDSESSKPLPIDGIPPEPPKDPPVPGDTFDMSGDFRGATINIKSSIQLESNREINREYMLKRVRKDWIEGVLDPAKTTLSLIELKLKREPQAVKSPWDGVVQRKASPGSATSWSNNILNIFDAASGTLLILGEPGAGKTITLLQLASELLVRAETRPEQPIPVVLNLSSWNELSGPLEKWLLEELRSKYFVPVAVAEDWMAKNSLILLLDGLDEVVQEKRPACIETINKYRQAHGPTQFAVCCRKGDYEDQPQRLQLDDAVLLQPLDEKQVNQILDNDKRGRVVADTLHGDASLSQLARTPLMLNIMMAASQDVSDADWGGMGSVEAHRQRLFDLYLKNVFRRRGPSPVDTEEITSRVLPWLARNLSEQGQTIFLMEGLDPQWLKTKTLQRIFFFGIRLLAAILLAFFVYLFYLAGNSGTTLFGFPMAVSVGTCAFITSLISERLNKPMIILLNMALTSLACGWVLGGWLGGLIAGLVLGIPGGAMAMALQNPQMTDRLRWSWNRTLLTVLSVFILEAFVGIVLYKALGANVFFMLTTALQILGLPIVVGGVIFVFGRAVGVWHPSLQVVRTVATNEGFWQSLRNAIGISLFLTLVLLPFSLPIAWSFNFDRGLSLWSSTGFWLAIPFVIASVSLIILPLGLLIGGAACLQQIIIRIILSTTEKLPWNLIQILDQATERIILQKVGGGYNFQHRLLQDYFADPKFTHINKEKEQP